MRIPRLLSAVEVAMSIGVTVKTLRRLYASGDVPAPVRIGANLRWRPAELEFLVPGISEACLFDIQSGVAGDLEPIVDPPKQTPHQQMAHSLILPTCINC